MKNHFYAYLQSLSKDELINIIYKTKTQKKTPEYKSIRTIVLRISYIGVKYNGLAPYKLGNTIGNHIENALELSGLGSKVTYAGRTDSGVSAVEMIASLEIKSNLVDPINSYINDPTNAHEFKYDVMLNSYLPNDIRVTGWAPVPVDFSARFSCTQRQYRYYFDKTNLSLDKMIKACDEIKKMTNFYHLSKHSDPKARYTRHIDECKIVDNGSLAYLDIRAKSFLHNMVRKIFFVLHKHGKSETVDFDKIGLASPYNLVFFRALYSQDLQFISNYKYGDLFFDSMVDSNVLYHIKSDIYDRYKEL